jgi:asparagine synthase (glutamine-hydrolysing)
LISNCGVSPEFARRVNLGDRVNEYNRNQRLNPKAGLFDWHKHKLQVPYLVAGIERYERLASYFGIDTRHPLMDIRLLKLSAALPLEQRVRGGWTKYMLRIIASSRLPHSVAWREGWEELGWKFGARLTQSVKENDELQWRRLKESLSSYLDHRQLAKYQFEFSLVKDPELLAAWWRDGTLQQWLSQLSGNSPNEKQ